MSVLLAMLAAAAAVAPAQAQDGGGGGGGPEPIESTTTTATNTTPLEPPAAAVGAFVVASDSDVNLALLDLNGAAAVALCHVDEDGGGDYDAGEMLVLDVDNDTCGPTHVHDIRLTAGFGSPAGSLIRVTDVDFNVPTRGPGSSDAACAASSAAVSACLEYYDANGNAALDGEDTMYVDIIAPGSGRVDVGDLRLTPFGHLGGLRTVGPAEGDINLGLLPVPFAASDSLGDASAIQFHDGNGDANFNVGDRAYWHRSGLPGQAVAAGDVRLAGSPPTNATPPSERTEELVRQIEQLAAQLNATLAQNAQLQQENAELRALLGNGTDLPPVARIAPVPAQECYGGGSSVVLDGMGSFDPDGEAITFAWSAPGAFIENPDLPRTRAWFPLGSRAVTLTVRDGPLVGTAGATVVVQDTQPPSVSAWVGPSGAGGGPFPSPSPNATSPVPPVGSGGPGGGAPAWFREPVDVRFLAWDACREAAVRFWVGSGPLHTGDLLTLAREGAHDVTYFAVDGAGNASGPGHLQVRIDLSAPVTLLGTQGVAGDGGWWRSAVTITLADVDERLSGRAGTFLAVDDGPFEARWLLNVSGDGRHVVRYYSVDLAGNVEAERAVHVDIDGTPPEADLAFEGRAGDDGWWWGDVRATLVARDATSGVVRITHRAGDAAGEGGTVLLTHEGAADATFHATDAAGNTVRRTASVRIDRTDPVVGIEVEGAMTVPGTGLALAPWTVTVNATGFDGGAGLARAALYVDGALRGEARLEGARAKVSFAWAAGDEAAGTHVVEVRVTDRAGREASRALTITTAPTTEAGLLATAECDALLDDAVCGDVPAAPGTALEACRLVFSALVCDRVAGAQHTCEAALSEELCRTLAGSLGEGEAASAPLAAPEDPLARPEGPAV